MIEDENADSPFRLFAYGSLLFEHEFPEDLIETATAELPGYRRAFNKLSLRRATAYEESFDAFDLPGGHYRRDGKNLSLALGTEASLGQSIVGGLQIYPGRILGKLQPRLDRREGFSEKRPSRQNGYLRSSVELMRRAQVVPAITYLTNPDEACIWTIGPEIDVILRAKILINATPREVSSGLARGLDYLQKTRQELASIGARDAALEELAEAVRSFDGPWRARVADL